MGNRLDSKDLHNVLLLMLNAFHQFCEYNHITYFLAFGTLIGAVRHNGFIPWDDDVDIIVPRPDFEKIISFNKINERYDIVSNKNPNGYYHPFLHANITDTHTCMDEHDLINPTGKGVFLDVFPLDGLPKKKSRIMIHCKRLQFSKAILGYTVTKGKKTKGRYSLSIKNGVRLVCRKTLSSQRLINSIQKRATKYSYECSKNVAVSVSMPSVLSYKHFVFKKDLFTPVKHSFENYNYYIPTGYDDILRSLYGDYMTPPPVNERNFKHDIIYYWKENDEGN